MKNSKFITLEGGDGTGKSTQIDKIAAYLESQNIKFLVTREPGGSLGAELIRKLLVEGRASIWDGITETLLFAAARRDHLIKTIWPALNEGKWVICDRFQDSSVAYQGYGHNVDIDFINFLYFKIAGDFIPDLTLVFDLPVDEGLKRAKSRKNDEDRFEQMDEGFHERLRNGYLKIVKKNSKRCVLIDADYSEEEVFDFIVSHIKEILKI